MSTSNLPPLRNLPSWSRVRDLDRVRYPRLLSSDPVVRAPPVGIKSPKAAAQPRTDTHGTSIASLEKAVLFLQQQHTDTLERLHAEVEDLKRVNKGVLHCSPSSFHLRRLLNGLKCFYPRTAEILSPNVMKY